MKIALISIYESIVSYGLRCISSVIKDAGFPSQTIFLPRESEGLDRGGFRYPFGESVLQQLANLTQDCDLIGISVMSNYYKNAVQITQYLHQNNKALIVWGGVHPTILPEECLQFADLICVGEGEDATLELVQNLSCGKGYKSIANIWYKSDGKIVRTPLRPLQEHLDTYLYPDYDLINEMVLHNGVIRPMTYELMLDYLRWPINRVMIPTYTTLMSRGCTWSCTYCCNNAYKKLFKNQWKVRKHSVSYLIGELVHIISSFPGIESIKIEDDVFLDEVEILREFSEVYKKKINLPLFISGFQPSMVTEEKIKLLVDAGMIQLRMGIQTCSISTLHNIYRRPGSLEQIRRAIEILHKFTDQIGPPSFDLLIDNPWESNEEQLKTLNFLLDIPKPYKLQLFSLTLYPGTDLYERGIKEGILQDEQSQVYAKDFTSNESTYLNWLFRLFQTQLTPRWLMKFLLSELVHRLNWIWLPRFIYWIFRGINLINTGWRAFLRGDWNSLRHAFSSRLHWLHRNLQLFDRL